MRDVVVDVNSLVLDKLQPYNISIVSYEHGHYPEINQTLLQKEESGQYKFKYPLIALIEDISETSVNSIEKEADVLILICHSSNIADKSHDRHEQVIKPVLEPILDTLRTALSIHPNVVGYPPVLRSIKRPYYSVGGNARANVFDDVVDVIEVRTKIRYKNC